jgi:hypothetical protein
LKSERLEKNVIETVIAQQEWGSRHADNGGFLAVRIANEPGNAVPIDVWHHDVGYDDIEALAVEFLNALTPVGGGMDIETAQAESFLNDGSDVLLVVYDQHPTHGFTLSSDRFLNFSINKELVSYWNTMYCQTA